jgi:hypothetical protein
VFYRTEGKFGSPEFKIIAEELYLMDEGSSAYTEYSFDEEFVSFLMKNPRLLPLNRGHIHSHNSMGVFFSGTDNSELVDNAPNYNHYFSLIVNNRNDMTARVAFVVDIQTIGKKIITYKDTNGELIQSERETDSVEKKVYFYECDITKPEFIESSKTRIAEIRAKKPVTTYPAWNTPSTQNSRIGGTNQTSLFRDDREADSKVAKTVEEAKKEWKALGQRVGSWSDDEEPAYNKFKRETTYASIKEDEKDEEVATDDNYEAVLSYEEAVEAIAARCILCDVNGTLYERFSCLEEVLEDTAEKKDKITKKEWYTFCEKVKDTFHKIYHSHFNDPELNSLQEVVVDVINLIRVSAPIGTGAVVRDITETIEDAIK